MLTFTLTGSVSGMHPTATGDLALQVLSSRSGSVFSVLTICRDPLLSAHIERRYGVGDPIRIDGELEPCGGEIGGIRPFDALLVVHDVEAISVQEACP